MTPEQEAINLFLSKPAPYNSACGCMGAQPLRYGEPYYVEPYQVILTDVPNRVATLHVLRNRTGLGALEAKNVLDSGKVVFQTIEDASAFVKELAEIDTLTVFNPTEFEQKCYPVCPCAMQYVVEVDNQFYEIQEDRTPSGITHTATLLGPVGGPYINLDENGTDTHRHIDQ